MKKMLSLILAVVMLLGCNGQALAAESSDEGQFLNCGLSIALGIVDPNIPETTLITRRDLAVAAVKLINCNVTEYEKMEVPFSDINANDKEIIAAGHLGLISGYGDGTFKPNQKASFNEVLAVFVNLAGWKQVAASYGGFPLGYTITAGKIDILEGVKSTYSNVPYGTFARLIENTLHADYPNIVSFSSNGALEYSTNETVLNYYFHIYGSEGRVTAQGVSALTGYSSTVETDIAIDGRVYHADSVIKSMNVAGGFENFVGYNVEYYYRDNDKTGLELIYLSEKKRNEVVTIYSSQLNTSDSGYNVNNIVAIDRNGRNDYYRLDAPDVFYNDVNYYDYTLDSLKPDCGKIVLVDNDGDGSYEVVKIYEYVNYVVKQVNVEENYIYDFYDKQKLKIDLTDEENYILDLYGNKYELSDLKKWDVLSVFSDVNGKVVRARLIRNSVKGSVTAVSGNKIYLNSQSLAYELSDDYLNLHHRNKVDVTLGTMGEFYLDVEGKICCVQHSNNTLLYGYLTHIGVSSGLDDTVKIKMMTSSGQFSIFELKTKVKVNGVRDYAKNIMDNSLLVDQDDNKAIQQLIKYKTDDEGLISEIWCFDINDTNPDENALVLESGTTSKYYNKDAGLFDSQYILSDECIIFRLPSSGELDETTCDVGGKSYFSSTTYGGLYLYDCGDKVKQPKAIVYKNYNMSGEKSEYMVIATGKGAKVDDNGDVVSYLRGYYGGKEEDFITDNESLIANIQRGDIVRLKTNNTTKYITSATNYFGNHSNALYNPGTTFVKALRNVSSVNAPYWSMEQICCGGYVDGISDTAFYVWAPTSDSDATLAPVATSIGDKSVVYIVDYSEPRHPVTVASYADLMDSDANGSGGDYVFIFRRSDVARDIVIVRGFQ